MTPRQISDLSAATDDMLDQRARDAQGEAAFHEWKVEFIENDHIFVPVNHALPERAWSPSERREMQVSKETDPLQNPRPIWKMHYDHRTIMGRWGRFIQRTLRLKTTGDRHLDALRRLVKERSKQ